MNAFLFRLIGRFGMLVGMLLGVSGITGAQILTKPVKLIVPYAAAGPGDAAARILADGISPILGVPVVVENRPGATGKIAVDAVKNAEPDGYTLFVGGSPQMVLMPILESGAKKSPFEELRMISMFTDYDIVFMAGEQSGIKTMKQLVAKMQVKNNDVSFASIGLPHLTPPGLAFLVMAKSTGGTAQAINYKGQAPGTLDMLAGRITFAAYSLTGMLQYFESGKIVPLAVASPHRLNALPNVPTMAELGYAEFAAANNWQPWIALAAPAKTADSVVSLLNRAVAQAAQASEFKAKLARSGLNARQIIPADQGQAAWREEFEKLSSTLKRFDIRAGDEAR
ncbi:tripartite tricarboxylate transporter substrate binding protein [Ottowia thiooxydans]|uniref:Tripartite-type tricarboxylate transporter receptor subunit TctC n=1 Tax=Ottowia thiooxydans TaxID=219182 RepID=A0ABV2Q5P1_9BURK